MALLQAYHTEHFPHLRNIVRSLQAGARALRSFCVLCCAVLPMILVSNSFPEARLYAQLQLREPVEWRAGIFGQYGLNFHVGVFDSLTKQVYPTPYSESTGRFTGGTGQGWTAGVLFEKPLSHQFSFAGRLMFSQLSATMSILEPAFFIRDSAGFSVGTDVNIASRFSTDIFAVAIEPQIAWHPIQNLSVYLGVRMGASWGTRFQDFSLANDPTGLLTFPEPYLSRTIVPDSLRAISNVFVPQISASAGLSYSIPLDIDETLFIVPEIWYAQNVTPFLNNLAAGQSWFINTLRGGLSVRYSPEAARRFLPPAIVRTAETPQLSINITPLALDSSGAESPLLRLRLEETLSRQMHPLLPYIFFDKNGDVVPARYTRLLMTQTTSFSEKIFAKWGTLEIYYHALNIVGKRLRENPTATIRIVGCASADEYTADSSHIVLATRRAEAVMTYLRDVWRISSERMNIEARGLPEEANTLAADAANAENRRVEIYSDVWNILRPVTIADTLLESTPPAVKFVLRANTKGRISKWRFKIDQGKNAIQNVSGLGAPENELYWHPSREQRTIPRTEEAVRCNFDFLEEEGEGGTATISIPIEQVTIAKKRRKIALGGAATDADKQIDIYRFIQFSPESTQPTQAHERLLGEIVQAGIDAKAIINIAGFTDVLGNPTQNLQRSTERAKNIANALTSIVSAGSPLSKPIVAGFGSKMGVYSQQTPEGRLYSRMVELRIETTNAGK